MRFDDRLATALGQTAETGAARQVVWRQLVDLLGQSSEGDAEQRADALGRLRQWRSEVPPASRQSAAILLARHPVSADLVELFAEDLTAVAAPLLATVSLPAEEWVQLIPRLSPVARALLRHRRDLPAEAMRVLEAYGPADLVIPGPVAPSSPQQDLQTLRARVDALREERRQAPVSPPAPTRFDFETGPDGIIRWCDLPNRGAVLGLGIAEPAQPGHPGVDGQAAGAFRHRDGFRHSRLWLSEGEVGGAWSMSGVPVFDPATGRFLGFRGSARRPQPGERADEPGLLGSSLTGDAARQFAHEMRTPLNAIAGFAEMIQRQMLGPASTQYRDHAAEIMSEARRIGAVLDELEEAARFDGRASQTADSKVDCTMLVARITSALGAAASDKAVQIALSIAPACAEALIEPALAERLTGRLLSTCVGLAGAGERLDVEVTPGTGQRPETIVSVTRPKCVAELTAEALFDACDVDGAEVEPPLGLGFTLRLVRHGAETSGGRFAIERERFSLSFPAVPAKLAEPAADAAANEWADWLRRQSAGPACHAESGSAIAADPVGPVAQR